MVSGNQFGIVHSKNNVFTITTHAVKVNGSFFICRFIFDCLTSIFFFNKNNVFDEIVPFDGSLKQENKGIEEKWTNISHIRGFYVLLLCST